MQISEKAKQKWLNYSLAEQLGNIGSEVDRVIMWQDRKQDDLAEKAFYRAIELLDLSKSDPRWAGRRRRELCRLREVFCDAYYGSQIYATPLSYFSKYCYDFALVANKQKLEAAKPKE